jgi:hypothetical protein
MHSKHHANTQVGDFGLSKVKEIQKIHGTYRMTGKTGTMRYMAPEVFQVCMCCAAATRTRNLLNLLEIMCLSFHLPHCRECYLGKRGLFIHELGLSVMACCVYMLENASFATQ